MLDSLPPDHMFSDAILLALARALRLTTPDNAAQLAEVCREATEPPPEPEEVEIPFGCVKYIYSREPKIVPQLSVGKQKLSLGHYPYTQAGADLAARVRAAAVAVKQAGGDAAAIRAAAQQVRNDAEV